jgi:hypothetical protein
MKITFNPRMLYPAKLSFKINGVIKIFHDKQKLKQKILQGILHTEDESKTKPREDGKYQTTGEEKTRNQSSIDSTTHNQVLKQQNN